MEVMTSQAFYNRVYSSHRFESKCISIHTQEKNFCVKFKIFQVVCYVVRFVNLEFILERITISNFILLNYLFYYRAD